MANQFVPTAPQIAAIPVIDGRGVLTSQSSLSSGAVTHVGWSLAEVNLASFSVTKFGTITNDCSLQLEVSVDAGVTYRLYKSYTNAQIANTTGVILTEQVKGTHVRFTLLPGTMTGANGFNVRMYA